MKEKLLPSLTYWYHDGNIEAYVRSVIDRELGGVKQNAIYLLKERHESSDGLSFLRAYLGAVSVSDRVSSTSIEYFFDKRTRPNDDVVNSIKGLLDGTDGEEELRKAVERSQFESIRDILTSEGNAREGLTALLKSRKTTDVIDEVIPSLLPKKNDEARILFPYNTGTEGSHWVTGEINIKRTYDTESGVYSYLITLTAHDPYGGGCIDSRHTDSLKCSITERITEEHAKLTSTVKEIIYEFPNSVYVDKRQQDCASCGVITAEEIIKRMRAEDLCGLYPEGAEELRRKHLDTIREAHGEESGSFSLFQTYTTMHSPISSLLNDQSQSTVALYSDLSDASPAAQVQDDFASKGTPEVATDKIDAELFNYPTDFTHAFLSIYCAKESGKVAGGSKIKSGDKITLEPERIKSDSLYKTLSTKYDVVECSGDFIERHVGAWTVLETVDEQYSGYFSMLCVNHKSKHLILAHRSTNFDVSYKTRNILKGSGLQADLRGVVAGEVTMHQGHGYIATRQAVERARELGYTLSFTGQSLGAWLAQLSVYYCNTDPSIDYPDVKAITFDSPGARDMMEQMSKGLSEKVDLDTLDIVSYLSAPNPVNCMNTHVGRKYTLSPKLAPKGKFSKVSDAVLGLFFGAEKFTDTFLTSFVEGHKIDYMFPYFDVIRCPSPTHKQCRIDKWPSIVHRNFGGISSEPTSVSTIMAKIVEKIGPSDDFSQAVKRFMLGVAGHWINKIGGELVQGWGSETTTLGSIVCLIHDMLEGKIDLRQIWAVHEHLDRDSGYADKTIQGTIGSFELRYTGNYIVTKMDSGKLRAENRKYYIDRFLQGLKKHRELLSIELPLVGSTIFRLTNMYSCYKLGSGKLTETIQVNERSTMTVDDIRDAARKLSVYQEIKDCLGRQQGESTHDLIASFSETPKDPSITLLERKILDDIHKLFSEGGKKIVAISGLPGVGKTCTALQYAQKYSITYRWFSACSQTSLQESYLNFFYDLHLNLLGKPEDHVVRAVNNKLTGIPQRFLFIFDNVENYDYIRQYVLNLPKNVLLLITTRDKYLLSKSSLEILPFTEEEGALYLKENINGISEENIDLLKRELNCIPQHLSIAVGYLKAKRFEVDKITKFISDLKRARTGESEPGSLKPIFTLVFDDLKDKDEVAFQLLHYIACLNPDFIPIELLNHLVVEASRALHRLSLLSIVGHIETEKDAIHVHRVIQEEYIRYLAQKNIPNTNSVVVKTIKTLNSMLTPVEGGGLRSWKERERYVSSTIAVFEFIQKNSIEGLRYVKEMASLHVKLGYVYKEILINNPKYINHMEASLAIYNKQEPLSYIDVASSLNRVGIAKRILGYPEEALSYHTQALSKYQSRYGYGVRAHADIAATLTNIASTHSELRDVDKALDYYNQALRMYRSPDVYGAMNHRAIAMVLNNLGNMYRCRDMEKALDCYDKALSIYRSPDVYGDRPCAEIAKVLNHIGDIHYTKGGREAIEYYTQALSMYRSPEVHGNRGHPAIAETLIRVGSANHAHKEVEKALTLYGEVLEIYKLQEQQDCIKHRQAIAKVFNLMGIAHQRLRDYDKALESYKKALNIYENQDHVEAAGTLKYIGRMYNELGDIEKTLSYYDKALEMYKRTCGTHPNIKVLVSEIEYAKQVRNAHLLRACTVMKVEIFYDNPLYNYHKVSEVFIKAREMGGQTLLKFILDLSEYKEIAKQMVSEFERHSIERVLHFINSELITSRRIANNDITEKSTNLNSMDGNSGLTRSTPAVIQKYIVPPKAILQILDSPILSINLCISTSLVLISAQDDLNPIILLRVITNTISSAVNRWFGLQLKHLIYREELAKLESILSEHCIEDSINEVLSDKGFRTIALALHPDKGGNAGDFAFAKNLKDAWQQDINIQPLLDAGIQRVQPILYKATIGFKVLDIAVDTVRFYQEPQVEDSKKLIASSMHLYSMYSGSSLSILPAAISVADTYMKSGAVDALYEASIHAAYLVLPSVLIASNPYVGFAYTAAITGMIAYNAVSNAYDLYQTSYGVEQNSVMSLETIEPVEKEQHGLSGTVDIQQDAIINL